MIYIYLLRDPRTNKPRYVGLSRQPVERLKEHNKCRSSNRHMNNWINQLKRLDMIPVQQIIYTAETSELADNMERYFIRVYRRDFPDLINLTSGGERAFTWSEEIKIKLKISASKGGKAAWPLMQAARRRKRDINAKQVLEERRKGFSQKHVALNTGLSKSYVQKLLKIYGDPLPAIWEGSRWNRPKPPALAVKRDALGVPRTTVTES